MIAQHPTTNPILNDPWSEPEWHWELDPTTNLATDVRVQGRRKPSGRSLMPRTKQVRQAGFYGGGELFDMISNVRDHVAAWRRNRYPGVSKRTKELLEAWASDQSLPMRPFFCQREAVETVIWLFEARDDDALGIQGTLEGTNARFNDGIMRVAMKMATGSGKTAVMAMLMIWHAVNHAMPRDFLIIAPNLTVKERLQELRSDHPEYLLKKLTPTPLQPHLNRLNVTIENFQAFQKRDTLAVDGVGDTASGAERRLLRGTDEERWKETDEAMLGRLLKDLSPRDPVVVINDEAHHCYRMNDPADAKKGSKDERDEKQRAQLWFNVLKVLDSQGRLDRAYDLSATPMFLDRPADAHTEHFPWIVSDYPLSDAIEAGLTKIPRLPVADDTEGGDAVYRDIYGNTAPKTLDLGNLATSISDPLKRLHEHYEQDVVPAYEPHTIPVMIVVANRVNNAETLYQWIAGYHDEENDVYVPGNLPMFSNVKPDRSGFVDNPPTLLVHSKDADGDDAIQISGQVAKQHAKLFAPTTESLKEQKAEIKKAFNTVGKAGQPGEHIRCVVSVDMLTEGWDAKTVTHILGYRAFKSQLLCEQVTGRALRRTSFEPDPDTGMPVPEFANVFGVPYEFMASTATPTTPPPPQPEYEVGPVDGRENLRITFPNLAGYAWTTPDASLRLDPAKVQPYSVDNPRTPTKTELAGIFGERLVLAKTATRQQVVWHTAWEAYRLYESRDTSHHGRRVLFASMVTAVEEWLEHEQVKWSEGSNINWLLEMPHVEIVPELIARACFGETGAASLQPVFAKDRDPMQERFLSTDIPPFETALRPVFPDDEGGVTRKSEINVAPCHASNEVAIARALDTSPQIEAWARNYRLGWKIPWRDDETGQWGHYEPDFVARVKEANLHLIIEGKGKPWDDDADAKQQAVEQRWIPAVESIEGQGRWRYILISEDEDPFARISRVIEDAMAEEESA